MEAFMLYAVFVITLAAIVAIVVLVLAGRQRMRGSDTFTFGWRIGLPRLKGEARMPLELEITSEQQIPVTLTPTTPAGQPATLDGEPVWEVTAGDGTVAADPGGMRAMLVSPNAPGDTTYTVSADADMGAGVVTVADTITLHVVNPLAASLGLAAGEAELKPPPTP